MSVHDTASGSRMPDEQKYVEAVLGDDYDLGTRMAVEADTTIEFYTEDEVVGQTTYDEPDITTLREALVDAVADDEEAADAAREAVKAYDQALGMTVATDPDAETGLESAHVTKLAHTGSSVSQDVMEHELRDGMCNCCGAEMDMVVAQPGDEDLDVYMYDCEECGNEGHYFGGEETEDGAVAVWSEFSSEEALSRDVDVREGATLTVYDLDEGPANPLEREPGENHLYSVQVGSGWRTRPDGLLQRLLDRPVPIPEGLREEVEQQLEDPNMGVLIEDPTGGSDVEESPEDHYLKVVDDSQVEFQGIR